MFLLEHTSKVAINLDSTEQSNITPHIEQTADYEIFS